jgi:hypothetical protein
MMRMIQNITTRMVGGIGSKQVRSCQPRGQDAAKVNLQVALYCFSIPPCFFYRGSLFLPLQVKHQITCLSPAACSGGDVAVLPQIVNRLFLTFLQRTTQTLTRAGI